MTASKPAPIRLSVLVDAEDERLCGKDCPRKTVHGECFAFAEDGNYTMLAENREYDEAWSHNERPAGWWRSEDCLAATQADTLDRAIVEAAERVRDDVASDEPSLFEAVDAKRDAEELASGEIVMSPRDMPEGRGERY